jgi:hypothetical protein
MSQIWPSDSLSAVLPRKSAFGQPQGPYKYMGLALAVGVIGYLLYRKYHKPAAAASPSSSFAPPLPAALKRAQPVRVPGNPLNPQPGSRGWDSGHPLQGAVSSADPLAGLPQESRIVDGQLVIGASDIQAAMLTRGDAGQFDTNSGRKVSMRFLRRDPDRYQAALAEYEQLADPDFVIRSYPGTLA